MPQTTETDLRRIILDVTRDLLLKDGYNNLSMRKIARSTGYSATSIYLYFENKDSLFHALIEEGFENLYGVLQATSGSHVDPIRRLEALCQRYVRYALENPAYYEIMFQLHPEQMARYPAEKYRRARRNLDLYAAALAEGVEAGVFQVENPRVTASSIWVALHGMVSLLLSERVDIRIDADELLHTTVGLIVRGCLAPGRLVSDRHLS